MASFVVGGRQRRWSKWLSTMAGGLVAAAALFGGCALDRSGNSAVCTAHFECDGGNPCMAYSCSESGKLHRERAGRMACRANSWRGIASSSSVWRGSCKSTSTKDDEPDDDDPCTEDTCDAAGVPANTAKDEGASCDTDAELQGSCQSGQCVVECVPGDGPGQCDDGNVCTEDGCGADSGQCENLPLNGNVVSPEPDGDCQLELCQDGVVTTMNDNTDLPDDGNGCTLNQCNEGMVEHPPEPAGTACDENGGQVCDGALANPQCVQCVVAADCEDHFSLDFLWQLDMHGCKHL